MQPSLDSSFSIRTARPEDAVRVATIYDVEVAGSIATFDLEPPPVSVWSEKIGSHEPGDRFLVAEDAQGLLGFAYAGSFRPRPGYRFTRESSIYLDAAAQGRGLGRMLYRRLLEQMQADGVRSVMAVIAQPNPASEALHRSVGFAQVGTMRSVGYKLDRWIDVGLWQAELR